MTDYKQLKLITDPSPYLHDDESVRTIMMDVAVALCLPLIWASVSYGVRAVLLTAFSVAVCVLLELFWNLLLKKPQTAGDGSAVVTGFITAMLCPASIPLWMLAVGDFFAIVVAKQLFGGIGKNLWNPALVGHAAMVVSFPAAMAQRISAGTMLPLFGRQEAESTATILSYLKSGDMETLRHYYTLGDAFTGSGVSGLMGELSVLLLLVGGVYLLWRKDIHWQTPSAFIGTAVVLTALFPMAGGAVEYMSYHAVSGGLALAAFILAGDGTTSPMTGTGKLIYGGLCGVFTVLFRYFGAYDESAFFAVLLCNTFVPLIDLICRPERYGLQKIEKRGAVEK